jgi:3-oxoacyl-[acyl-carrier-protein] synthase-3
MKAQIAGVGSYAPDKVLDNKYFESIVDTSDEWIRTRSGIIERRQADQNTATSDLAIEAARRALNDAKMDAENIELIIVATATPDMPFPSTACLVQKGIGARSIMSFDIGAGCSGFLYALAAAESFMQNGYDNILVIGSEILTKITDYEDRSTCVLFGDAAGAFVLKKGNEDRGMVASYFGADANSWRSLYLPAGGTRLPTSTETVKERLHYLKMEGNEVFKIAVRAMADSAIKTLEKANINSDKISLLITHQANIRIIEATAKRLDISMDRVFVNLDRYGNTSAASIPLAFDEALRSGRIKKGDYVLLVAFGAGFTWGGVLIRW